MIKCWRLLRVEADEGAGFTSGGVGDPRAAVEHVEAVRGDDVVGKMRVPEDDGARAGVVGDLLGDLESDGGEIVVAGAERGQEMPGELERGSIALAGGVDFGDQVSGKGIVRCGDKPCGGQVPAVAIHRLVLMAVLDEAVLDEEMRGETEIRVTEHLPQGGLDFGPSEGCVVIAPDEGEAAAGCVEPPGECGEDAREELIYPLKQGDGVVGVVGELEGVAVDDEMRGSYGMVAEAGVEGGGVEPSAAEVQVRDDERFVIHVPIIPKLALDAQKNRNCYACHGCENATPTRARWSGTKRRAYRLRGETERSEGDRRRRV